MAVFLSVSVDWEGYQLNQTNLDAIQEFNEEFPDTPLEHFICPAYFTRGFDNDAISQRIRCAIKPTDFKSLHIHCWDSLIETFVSPSIKTPTYGKNDNREPGALCANKKLDYGHPVPLGLYSKKDITNIIAGSRQILAKYKVIDDLESCNGFRCGGWIASDNVLQGLEDVEDFPFEYDCSGASGNFCTNFYGQTQFPLMQWLGKMWGGVKVSKPAYMANQIINDTYPGGVTGLMPNEIISPPRQLATASRSILEVPNTGMLADYVTLEDWKNYIDRAKAYKMGNVYLTIGFHQESATWKTRGDSLTCIDKVKGAIKYFQQKGGDQLLSRSQMAQSYKQEMKANMQEMYQREINPA